MRRRCVRLPEPSPPTTSLYPDPFGKYRLRPRRPESVGALDHQRHPRSRLTPSWRTSGPDRAVLSCSPQQIGPGSISRCGFGERTPQAETAPARKTAPTQRPIVVPTNIDSSQRVEQDPSRWLPAARPYPAASCPAAGRVAPVRVSAVRPMHAHGEQGPRPARRLDLPGDLRPGRRRGS
jgi:hypothetical protein